MKPIKILLLTVAISTGWFIAVTPTFAQTWTQTSAPSKNWETVASSADGNKLIAGSLSWIYCISTNSGTTWITNTQPQKGSAYGSWSCIASSADGTKYVGILGNVIWVSTNSGTTWLSNNVPGVSFFGSVALSADGNKLVAVVGNNSSPGPIYTSTNSGVTLTQTTAPTNNWMSVASSADGTKLVAAAMNSQSGFIYASTNLGLTWALTGAPTNNSWATVASSADGSKLVAASWAAFVSDHIYGCVYTSTNFGMTWTSNNVPDAQWNSVASSADGTKLVAAAAEPFGLICSSTNSGATWISNAVPSESWLSVASSADGNQLVVAGMVDQSFNPGHVYISQTTPSPCLNLTPSSSNLAVSWIIPSTDFILQQNLDLTTTNWTDLTNPPVLNLTNLQDEVILSPTGSSGFYRLKTP
jgi:hypothetical protein